MPLDPKNRSGAEPNTIPFTRNDSVSQTSRANNPSTLDRAESHKDNSHYEGDNARWPYSQSEVEYDNPYKQVEGTLDVGLEDSIWQYEDKQIEDKLREKVSEKYCVSPLYVRVTIDRKNGKIYYKRTQYVEAAVVDEVKYEALEPKQKFQFGRDAYDMMSEEFKAKHGRKDVWVKMDETTATKEDGSATHKRMLKDAGVLVYKQKSKDTKFAETVSFSKLPQMHGFIFVDKANIPEIIKNWYKEQNKKDIPYDTMFQKVGKKIKYKGKTYSINGDPDVVDKGRYEEQYKYKAEDIEDALNSFFGKYKTYKTKWGEATKLPYDDFMKEMQRNNVSESKLNGLSQMKGKMWSGAYSGERHDFMWTHDTEGKVSEIEVTRS